MIGLSLNQDVLENLFSIYRLKGGNNKNPSARILRLIFRSYLSEMLIKLPGNENCEEQDAISYSNVGQGKCWKGSELNYNYSSQIITESQGPEPEEIETEVDQLSNDFIHKDASEELRVQTDVTLEQCSVIYFAGWLGKKCTEKFNCDLCNKINFNTHNTHVIFISIQFNFHQNIMS